MEGEKAVLENTTPFDEATLTPPDNGATPPVVPEIEKAIKLVELQQDLSQMVNGLQNLQRQVVAQMGAIQYLQQKIAKLNKVDKE